MKLLQAIKIFDMTMIVFLGAEGRLTVDRGTVRNVALAENP